MLTPLSRPRAGGLVGQRPLAAFFLLALLSNAGGSAFNIAYNLCLIVALHLNDAQQGAFRQVLWGYNLVAYPVCLLWLLGLLGPLAGCLHRFRAGVPIPAPELERCRRRLVDLPWQVVCLNFLGWVPGAVVFPLGICILAGWDNAGAVWLHFLVSFLVSALLTTVQTFFLLEWFLVEFVYGELFRDARPAEVLGAFPLRLTWRLFLYWVAVAVVPLVSLLAVALNFTTAPAERLPLLNELAIGVAVCGIGSSGLISVLVGRNMISWLRAHTAATEQITLGNYGYRIGDKRPDEFGRLTDRFNDMAFQLERGHQVREQMGQMVGPDMRDFILEHCPALDGWVQEITVLFIDIRSFTRRSAGEPPERVVELLNRFLSLAVAAIKEQRGWTDKFLGDGVMALFNTPDPLPDHADRALQAAIDLLHGLRPLNAELAAQGQAPLVIGVGIHTGPALVGCIGATIPLPDGRKAVRKAFTAIGETVNLAQRLEQLTKEHGGPILLSEPTRARLRSLGGFRLTYLGPTAVPGFAEGIIVHRAEPEDGLSATPPVP